LIKLSLIESFENESTPNPMDKTQICFIATKSKSSYQLKQRKQYPQKNKEENIILKTAS